MSKSSHRFLGTFATAVLCMFFRACSTELFAENPNPIQREFRAAWVATVANIDWPSRKNLSVAQQREEMLGILDRAQSLHLNAIVFQVRPSADAVYQSDIEPWSEYLTGIQGKAPESNYDPLSEWVTESHKRGLELHAWFNPYRARHKDAKSETASNHVSRLFPNAVKSYDGYLWMDPAEPDASDHTLKVILDVVRRYDIDGVHLDDYFYPYPANQPASDPAVEMPFPDDPSWQRYLDSNPQPRLSREDWRRRNVDRLIERMYRGIHEVKKHVKFGISPFGIGKPTQRPPGIIGFSQYDKLYADAELWLEKGWLDYFSPQLYWPIDQKPQAFAVLLDYWASHNPAKRHIWPGLYTSRINNSQASWLPAEIQKQIEVTRNRAAENPLLFGHIHFSMKALMENRKGISDQLLEHLYREPALVPACPWIDDQPVEQPRFTVVQEDNKTKLLHSGPVPQSLSKILIWKRFDETWNLDIVPVFNPTVPFKIDVVLPQETAALSEIRWAAVNRYNHVGPIQFVKDFR